MRGLLFNVPDMSQRKPERVNRAVNEAPDVIRGFIGKNQGDGAAVFPGLAEKKRGLFYPSAPGGL
jgi:hypothetical protein